MLTITPSPSRREITERARRSGEPCSPRNTRPSGQPRIPRQPRLRLRAPRPGRSLRAPPAGSPASWRRLWALPGGSPASWRQWCATHTSARESRSACGPTPTGCSRRSACSLGSDQLDRTAIPGRGRFATRAWLAAGPRGVGRAGEEARPGHADRRSTRREDRRARSSRRTRRPRHVSRAGSTIFLDAPGCQQLRSVHS